MDDDDDAFLYGSDEPVASTPTRQQSIHVENCLQRWPLIRVNSLLLANSDASTFPSELTGTMYV